MVGREAGSTVLAGFIPATREKQTSSEDDTRGEGVASDRDEFLHHLPLTCLSSVLGPSPLEQPEGASNTVQSLRIGFLLSLSALFSGDPETVPETHG